MTHVSDDVGQLDYFLSALLELSSDAIAPTDVPAHLEAHIYNHPPTALRVCVLTSLHCTCTAMSSGLLEAVSTDTQRDRASISIYNTIMFVLKHTESSFRFIYYRLLKA